MSELKDAVWEYIDVIARIGDGSLAAQVGEQRRRTLHGEILSLTGLSTFEFGGLPFWYKIENTDRAARRLYLALMKQVREKGKHHDD